MNEESRDSKKYATPEEDWNLRDSSYLLGGSSLKSYKRLNFRLYPSEEQKTLFAKTFGCCRVIYNSLLAAKEEFYQKNKDDGEKLKTYKHRTEKDFKREFEWMKEVDSVALQQARINLHNAYKNFYDSLTGKRKGKKAGLPRFKSKYDKQSYITLGHVHIDFDTKKIKLPKIGWVKFSDPRTFDSEILSVTISKNKSGQYFASILTEIEIPDQKIQEIQEDKIFAADMSCAQFLVSEQEKFTNPKSFRKLERKLKIAQRKVSKKPKGTSNRKKAQLKVNKIYQKIKNTKDDFLHKTSTELVKKYDAIILEDLNLEGMKKFGVAKSVALDFSFGSFVQMIKYKSDWQGKHFFRVNRFFPSSKKCSECGHTKQNLSLSEREFICEECGVVLDRDLNAARNIFAEGKRLILEAGINLKNSTVGATGSYAWRDSDLYHSEMSEKSEFMTQESIGVIL